MLLLGALATPFALLGLMLAMANVQDRLGFGPPPAAEEPAAEPAPAPVTVAAVAAVAAPVEDLPLALTAEPEPVPVPEPFVLAPAGQLAGV